RPIEIDNFSVTPIATPGHTATSICYHISGPSLKSPVLFTGDTLFVCGCGRIFECHAQTMHQSLMKLADLPSNTLVYPGHDYTAENIEFALTLNPGRSDLIQKQDEIQNLAASGKPTVPSTIAQEKQLNPFLCDNWKTFATRRKQKDHF
ncbi:MAG: hydroxyacylglutathione hydrolase C-terminal domain-containing protein, partial [Planctomycetota bacterium]